jgi:ZIP family zinc transporter
MIAGLSTGIGGLIVLLFERTNTKLLSVALGFSAGVMIYVSFVELLFDSRQLLIMKLGENNGIIANAIAFFGGILLIAIIDKLVPSYENPHESRKIEEVNTCRTDSHQKLLRTGMFTAVIIAIHNFPEGMATFVSSIQQPSLGIAIAVAVAIHNIPEGMSVAIPVFCATGDRRRAFKWSLFSGMAEPVGAMIAYFVLFPFLNDTIFGVLFAGIAGIMVFISLDELLPTAREYGEHHLSIYGLIAGMIVMAISLIFLM